MTDLSKNSFASWLDTLTGNFRLVILLTIVLVVAGTGAMFNMNVLKYPELLIPAATITTEYPGADPLVIETEITQKLERELRNLNNIDKFLSNSIPGMSQILIAFKVDADLNEVMRELGSKVDGVRDQLPSGSKPVRVERISMTMTPVLNFALRGDMLLSDLTVHAERLRDELRKLDGVSDVKLLGGRKECIEIQLYRHLLTTLGITASDVAEVIRKNNHDYPLGNTAEYEVSHIMKIPSRFTTAEELQNLPIAVRDERIIFLNEIADVCQTIEPVHSLTRVVVNDSPARDAILMQVIRREGSNTINTVESCKQLLTAYHIQTPGVEIIPLENEATDIRRSIHTMVSNGWQAMVLVFLVLLGVLGLRQATLAALAIPLTFLATLMVINQIGYTIDSMTLMGMVIALGLLVDDFILIIEGMHDGLSEGKSSRVAAREAVELYAIPSLSGSVTSVLAFLPLALMPGVDGKFMQPIAVTVAITLIGSYLVSVLLLPSFGEHFLRPIRHDRNPRSLFGYWFEKLEHPRWIGDTMQTVGLRVSRWLEYTGIISRWRCVAIICFAGVLFALSMVVSGWLPTEIYPRVDANYLWIDVTFPPGTGLGRTNRHILELERSLADHPEVLRVVSTVGTRGMTDIMAWEDFVEERTRENLAGLKIYLKPRHQRVGRKTSMELASELRHQLSSRTDWMLDTRVKVNEKSEGPQSFMPIEVVVLGEDLGELGRLTDEVKTMLYDIPGVVDIDTDQPDDAPALLLDPYLHRLIPYGYGVDDIGQELYQAITGEKVSTYIARGEDRSIHLRYLWDEHIMNPYAPTSPHYLEQRRPYENYQITSLHVGDGEGFWDSVGMLGRLELGTQPSGIRHIKAERAIRVTANVSGIPASDAINIVTKKVADIEADAQPGHRLQVIGLAAKQDEAFGGLAVAALVALLLIFTVLVVQFNSYVQPLIIMLSVPLSFTGVFFGFFWAGLTISFPSGIGMASLLGIVVNDAIILIETANRFRKQGLSNICAAARAAGARFRPIIVTTVTTVIGLVPLALSDKVWAGLCFAIIFGMIVATGLTLVVVPALYVLLSPKTKPE